MKSKWFNAGKVWRAAWHTGSAQERFAVSVSRPPLRRLAITLFTVAYTAVPWPPYLQYVPFLCRGCPLSALLFLLAVIPPEIVALLFSVPTRFAHCCVPQHREHPRAESLRSGSVCWENEWPKHLLRFIHEFADGFAFHSSHLTLSFILAEVCFIVLTAKISLCSTLRFCLKYSYFPISLE